MIFFAKSINFGEDVVFIILAIWWLLAVIMILAVNSIFAFIGIKMAHRKNKKIWLFSDNKFSIKPYFVSLIFPLIILTLGWWLAPITFFLLPLFLLLSVYFGYSQTIKDK